MGWGREMSCLCLKLMVSESSKGKYTDKSNIQSCEQVYSNEECVL